MRTWTVPELLAIARPGRSAEEEEAALEALRVGGPPRLARTTPRERRLARALAKKLRYAREVLITTTSGPRGPRMGANGGPHAPTRSGSTASLAPQAAAAANGQGLGIARSGSATSIASAASTASTALGTKAMRA